jgi:hypothetical protein
MFFKWRISIRNVWWDRKELDIADQSGPSGTSVINRYQIARAVTLGGTIGLSQQVAQFVTGGSVLELSCRRIVDQDADRIRTAVRRRNLSRSN